MKADEKVIKKAIKYANEKKEQEKEPNHFWVDKVREYFNKNEIEYNTFSYKSISDYVEDVE